MLLDCKQVRTLLKAHDMQLVQAFEDRECRNEVWMTKNRDALFIVLPMTSEEHAAVIRQTVEFMLSPFRAQIAEVLDICFGSQIFPSDVDVTRN